MAAATCLILVFAASASAAPTFNPTANPAANWAVTPQVLKSPKKLQVVRAVAIQPSGRIVTPFALTTAWGNLTRRPVIRLNTDGSRDYSWGHKGVAWVRVPGKKKLTIFGADSAPDGSIFISGAIFKGRVQYLEKAFVAKLSPDGTQDLTFGKKGAWTTDLNPEAPAVMKVAPTPDGGLHVVIAGFSDGEFGGGGTPTTLTSLKPDGTQDQSLGFGGAKKITGPSELYPFDAAFVGDDVYIVYSDLAGEGSGGDCQVRRHSFTTKDTFDRSFGTTGRALVPFPAAADDGGMTCTTIAATPDGGLLVGGAQLNWETEGAQLPFIGKLNANGFTDGSFGIGGTQVLAPAGALAELATFPDGNVLATLQSSFETDQKSSGSIYSLSPTGVPDPAFGPGGAISVGSRRLSTGLTVRGNVAIAVFANLRGGIGMTSRVLRITD